MEAASPKLRSTVYPDNNWEQHCSCANNNIRGKTPQWGRFSPAKTMKHSEDNPGKERSGFPHACNPSVPQTMPLSQLPKFRPRRKHAQPKGLQKAEANTKQIGATEPFLVSKEAQIHVRAEQTLSFLTKEYGATQPLVPERSSSKYLQKTLRTWLTGH